jgi:7,8-dihydroneopterin aldolase/epimerase/oxygenase
MTAFRPSPMWTEPSPQHDAQPLDLIFIEGFRGQTVIGIHATELHRPQPLVIDLVAGVARARACDTDQIADTIDYGEVRLRLQRLMAEHGVQLLEALAEQIAHILLYEFRAQWVRVRVAKPQKFHDVQGVGVMIERRRPPAAEPAPSRGAAIVQLLGSGMVPGAR